MVANSTEGRTNTSLVLFDFSNRWVEQLQLKITRLSHFEEVCSCCCRFVWRAVLQTEVHRPALQSSPSNPQICTKLLHTFLLLATMSICPACQECACVMVPEEGLEGRKGSTSTQWETRWHTTLSRPYQGPTGVRLHAAPLGGSVRWHWAPGRKGKSCPSLADGLSASEAFSFHLIQS